jgi:CDP-paratose 2-epimerase
MIFSGDACAGDIGTHRRRQVKVASWKILVTGSSGLIGSEAVEYFDRQGHKVVGVDNNMRRVFFGPPGDTLWNLERLKAATRHFTPVPLDIRDRDGVMALFREHGFDLVIHCAAQPSHDKAADIALLDFEVNALGTVNLLEATRQHARDAAFILMSTNKVYGDAPNDLPLVELATRWEYALPEHREGIGEDMRVDRSKHSLFGASKLAADVAVQEYGRYFGMDTVCFRGGCLTGPNHSGAELHGFLSYLVKCAVDRRTFTIYGYKGKQVRDQIHSRDVVAAFESFVRAPRPAAVYNLGGGRENSVSVLEAIRLVEEHTGRPLPHQYAEGNREGDHICYISDLRRLRRDYPDWSITQSLDDIVQQVVESQTSRRCMAS